jgi:hypothetical protein
MIKPFTVDSIREDAEGKTVFFTYSFSKPEGSKVTNYKLSTTVFVQDESEIDNAIMNYVKDLNA